MKKWLIGFFILLAVLGTAGFFLIEPVAEALILQGIESGLNHRVRARLIDFDLGGSVTIRQLDVLNKEKYPIDVYYEIPEVDVVFDPWAFLQGDPHLDQFKLHIHQVNAVRNAEGDMNLNETAGSQMELPVEQMTLIIDRVVFTDFAVARDGLTQTFNVNIRREYEDLESFAEIGEIIGGRELARSAAGRLWTMDPGKMVKQNVLDPVTYANAVVTDAVGQVEQTAGNVVSGTVDLLTSPFRGGNEEEKPEEAV